MKFESNFKNGCKDLYKALSSAVCYLRSLLGIHELICGHAKQQPENAALPITHLEHFHLGSPM